jgi:CBS domain containing-hemolysin-like protein
MLSGTELLIAALFIVALVLMSVIDFAFSAVNKISVRRLTDGPRSRAASHLSALLEIRAEVLMSVHIVIQMLLVAASVFLFGAFGRREIPYVAGMPGTIATMMVIILLFRHLVPRIIATRNPERILLRLFTFLRLAHFMLRPFSRVLMSVANYFHRWEEEMEPEKSEEETSQEEIQAFIDAGQEEGILESDEGEMIQSIVHFGDKVAREVMTPRTQIIAIDMNSSLEKLIQLIVAKRRTRIPVYRDDLDNIEGIVHERDVLRILQKGEKQDNLRALVKPVLFVPETKPVNDLLQEMKERGDHLVIVVDEYGGVSGLVTMEDLVEEIVGEIHDEMEPDDEKIIEEGTGVYLVPGSAYLSAIQETLGVPLVEETECTTVAGAVVELFGRLPSPGEKIEHGGIEIEILAADRRRVQRLRLKTLIPKRMTS